MNIADLLTARAETDGGRMAFIDETRHHGTLTFAEFDAAAHRLANYLRSAGLQIGDGVLVLQPVSTDLCLVLVALLRAGMVAVFLDPSDGRHHVDSCCRSIELRGFIGCGRAHALRLVVPAMRRIPSKWRTRTLIRSAVGKESMALPADGRAELSSNAPAMIRFTSGSTGEPKRAVRTHGFLHSQNQAIEQHLGLSAGQKDLITMPLFMLPNLAAGVTSIIPAADVRSPARINSAAFARQLDRQKPDRLTASPTLLEQLVDYASSHHLTFDFLRRIDTGGAPVFPRLLDNLAVLAPHAEITAVYGSTEAEPIALLAHREIGDSDRRRMAAGEGLLAGRPVPGLRLQLIPETWPPPGRTLTTEEFDKLLVTPGDVGEIIVHGAHVHPGQSAMPAAEPTKLIVNEAIWHRTGDLGKLDPHGRLWLLGRASARIVDSRGSLYPFQVEAAVQVDPRIRRGALIAIDGRRVLAVEVCRGHQRPELPDWVRASVDEVRPLSRLPLDRRHNAKVDYAELRHQLSK